MGCVVMRTNMNFARKIYIQKIGRFILLASLQDSVVEALYRGPDRLDVSLELSGRGRGGLGLTGGRIGRVGGRVWGVGVPVVVGTLPASCETGSKLAAAEPNGEKD